MIDAGQPKNHMSTMIFLFFSFKWILSQFTLHNVTQWKSDPSTNYGVSDFAPIRAALCYVFQKSVCYRRSIYLIGNTKYIRFEVLFLNNLIWYVSLFLIGWKIGSISVWMKKNPSKPRPLLELLFVVTAPTQSKLIGTKSSSH